MHSSAPIFIPYTIYNILHVYNYITKLSPVALMIEDTDHSIILRY